MKLLLPLPLLCLFCLPATAQQNSCASRAFLKDEEEREGRISATKLEGEQFDQLYQQYKSLLNGGDKSAVINLLDNVNAGNKASTVANLEGLSPYLSGEVIRRVVDEPLLSNTQKLQVLEKNPEVLRRTQNWAYITGNGGFSSQELDSLKQARQLSTERDSVEQELAASQARLHRGANDLIAYYLSDSTGLNLDSVRYWAGMKRSVSGELLIVDTYLREGDTTAALQTLQGIEQTYGITPGQHLEYDQLKALKLLDIERLSQGKSWEELSEPQLLELQGIAANDETAAGVEAQNILNFFHGEGEYHEPILPNGIQALEMLPENGADTAPAAVNQHNITAFPNPTKGEVVFQYHLPADVDEGELQIRNLQGKLLAQFALQAPAAAVRWDSAEHPAGLYTYSLVMPDGTVETHKLVVLR